MILTWIGWIQITLREKHYLILKLNKDLSAQSTRQLEFKCNEHMSHSLVAVILTSQRELFSNCGTYNPEIGDHVLIYGSIKENLNLGKAGLSNLDPRGILTRNTTRRTFVMLHGMLTTLSIQLMIKLVSGKHL